MKTALVVLLSGFFCLQAQAQRRSDLIFWPYNFNNKIQFAEKISLPESNVDALYTTAKEFAFRTFRNEKDTVLTNDAARSIVCKGNFYVDVPELGDKGKGYFAFTLTIHCRYKSVGYTITDFYHRALNEGGVYGGVLENDKAASGGVLFPRHYWHKVKSECYYKTQTTIEQLKESFLKNIEAD
jgi:hypothetical protein